MKTRHFARLLGMTLGAAHFLVITCVFLVTGGTGESQGYFILLLDFPLYLLLNLIPGGGFIMFGSKPAYISFFVVVGTLMYAVSGMILGYVIDRLRNVSSSYQADPR